MTKSYCLIHSHLLNSARYPAISQHFLSTHFILPEATSDIRWLRISSAPQQRLSVDACLRNSALGKQSFKWLMKITNSNSQIPTILPASHTNHTTQSPVITATSYSTNYQSEQTIHINVIHENANHENQRKQFVAKKVSPHKTYGQNHKCLPP